MTLKKFLITGTAALLLSTSFTLPSYAGDNTLGTLLGAAGGAAVGSQFGKGQGRVASIAVGTLVGAGVGSSIGRSYHRPQYYEQRTYTEYVYDRPHHRHWKHRRHHHHHGYERAYQQDYYHVVPVQQVSSYQTQSDRYCREFNQRVNIGGRYQDSYGTACYQPDGSWQVQD
jgi:surface antigen